ncbi:MAG: hypothetical protein EA377_02935 [Phycisphaerales bacterium]|nr:MAG: hypothetical protein EA377_02935 [Phycisphaerales bacterium]
MSERDQPFAANGRSSRPPRGATRPENPRRVRYGIKLKARDGIVARNWVARRWVQLLESSLDAEARTEGMQYARQGQIATFELTPDGLTARVQGRAPRPYQVQMNCRALAESDWQRLIEAMSSEALYSAKLLAGEMPEHLGELFEQLDIPFLDAARESITSTCTCEAANCKHRAAAGYLLAERLSDDPMIVFRLYGMPETQLLERLRQSRAMHTQGVAAAHVDPLIPETQDEPAPLETCLEDFWRSGPELAQLEQTAPEPHVAHALLRRLGPSPLTGRFPLVGLLASIYDEVSQSAIRMRDQAERLPEDPTE